MSGCPSISTYLPSFMLDTFDYMNSVNPFPWIIRVLTDWRQGALVTVELFSVAALVDAFFAGSILWICGSGVILMLSSYLFYDFTLHATFEELAQELDKTKNEFNTTRDHFEETNTKLEGRIKDLETVKSSLDTTIDGLNEKIETHAQQAEASETKHLEHITELEQKIQELTSTLTTSNKELSQIVAAIQQGGGALDASKQAFVNTIQDMPTKLGELVKLFKEWVDPLVNNAKLQQLITLNTQLEERCSKLHSTEQSLVKTEEKLDSTQQQLDATQKTLKETCELTQNIGTQVKILLTELEEKRKSLEEKQREYKAQKRNNSLSPPPTAAQLSDPSMQKLLTLLANVESLMAKGSIFTSSDTFQDLDELDNPVSVRKNLFPED